MGKAGRWLRSLLSGKKDRPRAEATAGRLAVQPPPPTTPKEKRWSFRRPVPAGKLAAGTPDIELDKKINHAAAADDPAVAVPRMSSRRTNLPASRVEDAAAVRIQATFRGYLARTALCALRGIVKLQALVRGQLVRKQAIATLRCMQALLVAQSRLRAQRVRVLHEHHHQQQITPPRPRQSPQHPRHRRSYEMDRSCEDDNAKIVEMDIGVAKDDRQVFVDSLQGRCSPAMTELSPSAYDSGQLDEFSLATEQSSPQSQQQHHGSGCPSYMANTESSRAKARSQSAPRQRTDALERQPSRGRKGTPPRTGAVARMQRSSSLVGAPAPRGGGGVPSSSSSGVRLDVSNASLCRDSECGSTTSSVLTAATVYSRTRSLVGFEKLIQEGAEQMLRSVIKAMKEQGYLILNEDSEEGQTGAGGGLVK